VKGGGRRAERMGMVKRKKLRKWEGFEVGLRQVQARQSRTRRRPKRTGLPTSLFELRRDKMPRLKMRNAERCWEAGGLENREAGRPGSGVTRKSVVIARVKSKSRFRGVRLFLRSIGHGYAMLIGEPNYAILQ